jgi:hypothetical protein
MILLLVTVVAVVVAVMLPVYLCARYLEWRAWDTDRRTARLRTRRLWSDGR